MYLCVCSPLHGSVCNRIKSRPMLLSNRWLKSHSIPIFESIDAIDCPNKTMCDDGVDTRPSKMQTSSNAIHIEFVDTHRLQFTTQNVSTQLPQRLSVPICLNGYLFQMAIQIDLLSTSGDWVVDGLLARCKIKKKPFEFTQFRPVIGVIIIIVDSPEPKARSSTICFIAFVLPSMDAQFDILIQFEDVRRSRMAFKNLRARSAGPSSVHSFIVFLSANNTVPTPNSSIWPTNLNHHHIDSLDNGSGRSHIWVLSNEYTAVCNGLVGVWSVAVALHLVAFT